MTLVRSRPSAAAGGLKLSDIPADASVGVAALRSLGLGNVQALSAFIADGRYASLDDAAAMQAAIDALEASSGGGSGDLSGVTPDAVDALGQFELLPLWVTGHSWVAADNQSIGARWWQRLASRLRVSGATAKGYSGKSIATVVNSALGGSNPWTVRTKALFAAICTINDISLYGEGGSAAVATMKRGYGYGWRALLSIVTANAQRAANSSNFVYSAGLWAKETVAASTDRNATGGVRFVTTQVGDYCEFTFTGPACDVFLTARVEGAGKATFTEGSTTLGELDLTAPVAQETPAIFRITGRSNATHTVRVTLTSGASLTVDSYRIPSTAPVPGLVLGEPNVQWPDKTFGTAGGQTMLADMKANILAPIVSEFPTMRFVDLQTGWDIATMLENTRHPNDKGCDHIDKRTLRAAATIPFVPGLNELGQGADAYPVAYVPPTGPTIPSGGQAGTA